MPRRNPTLQDFDNDMNQHRGGEYKLVGGRYVLELERVITHVSLTVWRAVERGGRYVESDTKGNRYEWDAVGRGEYDEYGNAWSKYRAISTPNDVQKFVSAHPYDGPREPYSE